MLSEMIDTILRASRESLNNENTEPGFLTKLATALPTNNRY